jgi:DnaJ family protein B protein 4
LPTVLEHGTQRGTPDREKKRSSWYEGGDFALFDTSDPPSTQNLFKSTTAAPATSASSAAAAAAAAANAEVAPGTITQELPVSLSDLLNGTKKRVKVQRLLLDSMSGELHTFTEVLDVQVYAGLRPGSRVTLAGRGDWIPALQRFGDLVFLLVEKRHDTYERDGRDLVMRVELSLYESLCGWSRTVETLCGRKLQVSPARPTPAGETLSVGPYGMPKFVGKDLPPGPRGELLLKVEVRWPSGGFDSRQRALLRQALVEGGRSPRR